jgi:hypothetical protein
MQERLTVHSGEYRHVEGLRYQVLGIAHLAAPSLLNENSATIGTALSVAGYEETHTVSGHQIVVSEFKNEQGSSLAYVKQDDSDVPDQVVVYRQLEDGESYPEGQLWWRPIENFVQHFTPLEQPT